MLHQAKTVALMIWMTLFHFKYSGGKPRKDFSEASGRRLVPPPTGQDNDTDKYI